MNGSINAAEGKRHQRFPSAFSHWGARLAPWLIALVTLLTLVPTLDGTGETVTTRDAPGVTLDEIFNIQAGVYLWQSFVVEGPAMFTPAGAERVFNQPLANPDHPPLGRFVIGLCHDLVAPRLNREAAPPILSVTAARWGSVLLFAVTVGLIGGFARREFGPLAGIVAAISFALMPRAYGHAHLAALETAVGLFFAWTVIATAKRWAPASVPDLGSTSTTAGLPLRAAIVPGILFGLTLLTKIQAVLLPVPIALWALWHWRGRAIPIVVLFGLIGFIVFFCGWPWLWLDPLENLRSYFGSKAQRPTLYCYYLGERYADVDVPWHYPFVIFLTTMPVGFLLAGLAGLSPQRRLADASSGERRLYWNPTATLTAGVVLFVLTFFALPGITVYDGERLFLVVFPLWAVLVGRGVAHWWSLPAGADSSLRRPKVIAGVVTVLGLIGAGESLLALTRLHPCQLSYYNSLVGGLQGADRLGFEPTYWRDSFTREFLQQVTQQVPAGATIYVAPVLHPANRVDLMLLSPLVRDHRLTLDAYDDQDASKIGVMRYVLVFRRHADPWANLEPAPAGAQLLSEVRRDGVQLAALFDLQPQ